MHQVSCPRTQWWDLTNMESHCQPWIRAMAEITTVQCHGDQKMKISHPVQLGAHRISWTIINRYYCGDGLQHYGFPITYSVAPNSWDILRWGGLGNISFPHWGNPAKYSEKDIRQGWKGTVKKAGFLSHRNGDRTYPPKPGLCKGSSKAVPDWTINAGGVCCLWRTSTGMKETAVFYPSVYVKIAIENGHLWWVFPLKMVIFHSYVSLPEGMSCFKQGKSSIFSRKTSFFLSWTMGHVNIFRGCARLHPPLSPTPQHARKKLDLITADEIPWESLLGFNQLYVRMPFTLW